MKKIIILGLIVATVAYADDVAERKTATSLTYVTNELDTRQDEFGVQTGTKAATFTNAAGGNAPREVKSDLGSNNNDTALPTIDAVNDGLNNKQNQIPARNTNTVLTYTDTPGTLGEKGIYQDNGTYATQQNNLVDAGTFNAALQNALDSEFVCANRPDAHDPVTGNCWLWEIRTTYHATQQPYVSATGTVVQDGTPTPTNPIYPTFYQQGNMILRRVGDYADSYDATTHKITRRVGVRVFEGTENWDIRGNFIYLSDNAVASGLGGNNLCSHFLTFGSNSNGTMLSVPGILRFYPQDSVYNTVALWKQFLSEQYATGTPVTIYYPLATPVEEDWTESTYNANIYLPQNQ